MSEAQTGDIKVEAHRLIESLPDGATWDDLIYRIYVRQCVESGRADAQAERVVEVDEVRKRFGLVPSKRRPEQPQGSSGDIG